MSTANRAASMFRRTCRCSGSFATCSPSRERSSDAALRSRTACHSAVKRVTHGLVKFHRATFTPCLVKPVIAQCNARSCDGVLIVALFVKRYWNAHPFAQARRSAPDGCCPPRSQLRNGQLGEAFQRPHGDNRVFQVTANRKPLRKTHFGELQVSIAAFGTAPVSKYAAGETFVMNVARDRQRLFEIR